MVRRVDGEPPLDSSGEKTPQPEVGQIWRQDFEKFTEPGFFKVMRVLEKEVDGKQTLSIYVRRLNPDTGETVGRSREIKEGKGVDVFLEKYQFQAENVEEFLVEKPEDISPFDALFPPENKDGAEQELPDVEESESTPSTPEAEDIEQPEEEKIPEDEPEPVPVEEPEVVTPEEEVAPEAPTDGVELKELTPEQKKRAELSERLGLTVELAEERALLEAAVDDARDKYITNLYHHAKKVNKIRQILNLNRNPEPEEEYRQVYEAALKHLQEFDIEHLQNYLGDTELEQDKKEASVKSYLERYNRLEGIALWQERQAIQVLQEAAEREKMSDFRKTLTEKWEKLTETYQKLSWKKKLAFGVTIAGLHAGAAVASWPVAAIGGLGWLASRVVTGAVAYKTTSKFTEQGGQWLGDKITNRKDTQALSNLEIASAEGVDTQVAYLAKLNEIAVKNIENSDKKLAAYERNSLLAKAASLTLIFGIPLGRYIIGDLAGAETVASADVVSSNDTSTATDHIEKTSGGEASQAVAVAPKIGDVAVEKPALGTVAESAGVQAAAAEVSFAAVTVTEADQTKGLWGIVQNQLPENMNEADKNRVAASVQNLIHNKLEGLTAAEMKEQYGFSSRDISLIKAGEVIKLNVLVSQEELKEIMDGKIVLPGETTDAPERSEVTPNETVQASLKTVAENAPGVTPGSPSYINFGVIGFEDTPLSPDQQHWKEVSRYQGNYAPNESFHSDQYGASELRRQIYEPDAPKAEEVSAEASAQGPVYSYEESRPQSLSVEHAPLLKENMNLLRDQLLDINHTEFGRDYTPGKWKSEELWALHKGRGIQDIIYFDQPRYDSDPRDHYQEWQERRIGRRGIYLAPMNPEPQLDQGPDPYANHTADQIEREYRHNISSMQRAALKEFGDVALPINRQETVLQYMARLATLCTRARLENPEFRLKF